MQTETIKDQVKADQWRKIIDYLKSDDCSKIVKFYSSADGWANLAYKGYRAHITSEWNLSRVIRLVNAMLSGSCIKDV